MLMLNMLYAHIRHIVYSRVNVEIYGIYETALQVVHLYRTIESNSQSRHT